MVGKVYYILHYFLLGCDEVWFWINFYIWGVLRFLGGSLVGVYFCILKVMVENGTSGD